MKGSKRRSAILASAAPIFNRQGYAGTSIAEILHATSLEKGGLYNHFASKEELAVASFEYAWDEVNRHFSQALRDAAPGLPYLLAYVDAFERYGKRPVIDGGCPLANAALESDDALPFLRDRVRAAFAAMRSFVRHHVGRAIERKHLAPDADADGIADFLIASLEGAMLLGRGLNSLQSFERAIGMVRTWLVSLENRA